MRYRIIILDDSATQRTLLTKTLSSLIDGAECMTFSTVDSLLSYLESENNVDLIITDFLLSDNHTGFEVKQAIENSYKSKSIKRIYPCLIVSSFSMKELSERGVSEDKFLEITPKPHGDENKKIFAERVFHMLEASKMRRRDFEIAEDIQSIMDQISVLRENDSNTRDRLDDFVCKFDGVMVVCESLKTDMKELKESYKNFEGLAKKIEKSNGSSVIPDEKPSLKNYFNIPILLYNIVNISLHKNPLLTFFISIICVLVAYDVFTRNGVSIRSFPK